VTNKHNEELEFATRLLVALGFHDAELKSWDRPDILAKMGSRRIGIEVTVFHADEESGSKGSALRAEEEKKTRKATVGPDLARKGSRSGTPRARSGPLGMSSVPRPPTNARPAGAKSNARFRAARSS
jgi:hypothetical protein